MSEAPRATDPRLDRVVIVLDHTQDLVNIAAVIRGMRNMGLSRIHLVQPEEFDAWRITGIAHRTDAIVEAMGSHEKMATRLLSDEGARDIFLGLLYEMLKKPDAPSLLAGRKRD